jgi:hypothetical protein
MDQNFEDPSPQKKLLVALTLIVDAFATEARKAGDSPALPHLEELESVLKNIRKGFPEGLYIEYPPDWEDIKPKGGKGKKCPHCGGDI